jgi:hypothetical protein
MAEGQTAGVEGTLTAEGDKSVPPEAAQLQTPQSARDSSASLASESKRDVRGGFVVPVIVCGITRHAVADHRALRRS